MNQQYVIITCDEQLYRVVVQVMWGNPGIFYNICLRLGGMHLLMSFYGSIGTLMADSSLEKILSEAFAGVSKLMLSGKKFPQNVRALRLLVEELLRPVFEQHILTCMNDFLKFLRTYLHRVGPRSCG